MSDFAKDEVLYFGCVHTSGHSLWSKRPPHPAYASTPWGVFLDTGLLQGKIRGEMEGQVRAECRGGWTAIAFWDRSVDTRPGSNSAFLLPAIIPPSILVQKAKEQWPEIFARTNFPALTYPEGWDNVNKPVSNAADRL